MFSRKSCYFFVCPKRNFLEVCVFLGRTLKARQVRRVDRASKSKAVTRSELFFAAPDGRIMVVPYTVEGEVFRPEKPRPWSKTRFVARPRTGPIRSFDLHPDGNRFALARETQAEAKQDKLVFFFNFFEELRRRVAVQK